MRSLLVGFTLIV